MSLCAESYRCHTEYSYWPGQLESISAVELQRFIDYSFFKKIVSNFKHLEIVKSTSHL